MEFHEYANLFPMMDGKEFVELKADIIVNGLLDTIVVHEDKILDGRNRYKACLESDIEPAFTNYSGTDPLSFVLSHNLHRRHLTESQRAMVAAKIANMPANTGVAANLQSLTSRAEAAEKLNVSERIVNTAKKVQKKGAPELIEAVETGEVSVSAASNIVDLPVNEQKNIVKKGGKAVREGIRRRRKPTKKDYIQRYIKAIETISLIKIIPEVMFDELTDEQHEKVFEHNERALNFISLLEDIKEGRIY